MGFSTRQVDFKGRFHRRCISSPSLETYMKLFWKKNLDRILARAVVVLDIFEVFEVLWTCYESIFIESAVVVLDIFEVL